MMHHLLSLVAGLDRVWADPRSSLGSSCVTLVPPNQHQMLLFNLHSKVTDRHHTHVAEVNCAIHRHYFTVISAR